MLDLRSVLALVVLCSSAIAHGAEIKAAVVISVVFNELGRNANFGSSDANGAVSVLPDTRNVDVLTLQIGNRVVLAQTRLPAGVEMMAGDRIDVTLDGRVLNLVLPSGEDVSALIRQTRFL